MATADPKGALAALHIETSPSTSPVFARHTQRQVSSPSHLKHTRQSIAAALTLRISNSHRRKLAEQNQSDASLSKSLLSLSAPPSVFEGCEAVPCLDIQGATEVDQVSPPNEPFYSSKVTLETFTDKHLTSPRQKHTHSVQSLAASLQMRKEMFSISNAATPSTVPAESTVRKGSSAPIAVRKAASHSSLSSGFHSAPEQKIGRIIRTPLARQRHANINHYDPVLHVWRPSHVPPPKGVK